MRYVMLVVIGLMLLGLMGCGGSGPATNTNQDVGTLTGQVSAADAGNYQIIVDGQTLDQKPSADGHFSIPDMPPGQHTISVISPSGMAGAHMVVNVVGGETTDIGDIQPTAGGQIAGLVSRVNEDGSLTPLSGVEVIADPEPIYVVPSPNDAVPPPVRDGDMMEFTAITDENGSYVIPAVPQGGYVVTVNVPGLEQGAVYVSVTPGDTAVADFKLQAAVDPGVGTIMGKVFAALEGGSSQPLEGAVVSVFSGDGWTPGPQPEPMPLPPTVLGMDMGMMPPDATGVTVPPYEFRHFSTLTAADGSYSLNVPSGNLRISVWAEGYEPTDDSVTLQPGQTVERDYTLNPGQDETVPGPMPGPGEGGGGHGTVVQ